MEPRRRREPRRPWRWVIPTLAAAVCLSLVGPAVLHRVLAETVGHTPAPAAGTATPDSASQSWLGAAPVGLLLGDVQDHRATVQSVKPGGTAALAGLKQGDVLVRVGDLEAPTADKAAEQIENAWAAGKSALDLVVSRTGHDLYVALRLHS